MLERLGIVGTGMIGGSFALALREAGGAREFIGYDTSPEAVQEAIALGVLDHGADTIDELVAASECILVAVPVSEIAPCVKACLSAGADFVMEAGSVKQPVFDALGALVNERFVSVHPIAGSDKSGAGAARADTYRGSVLAVIAQGSERLRQQASALWSACGASPVEMDIETHDGALALTSHLPHLLAFALMRLVSRRDAESLSTLVGPGFRDFTRLARADSEVWQSIFDANREALNGEISRYQAELESMRALLGDPEAMRAALRQATETFTMLR